MAGTGYTVASAAQLLGAKTAKYFAAPEDLHVAKRNQSDQENSDRCEIKRASSARESALAQEICPNRKKKLPDDEQCPPQTDSIVENASASRLGTVKLYPDAHGRRMAEEHLPQLGIEHLVAIKTTNMSAGDHLVVPAIYFSPNKLNKSSTSLSSPRLGPTSTICEGKLTINVPNSEPPHLPSDRTPHVQEHTVTHCLHTRKPQIPHKLLLSQDQVNRMNASFAETLPVHMHIGRHDYGGYLDDVTTTSPTSSSKASTYAQASGMYSHSNTQFTVEARSLDEDVTAEPQFEHNQVVHNVALTDLKVRGTPVRFLSSNFPLGANVLNVGDHTYLNTPYEANSGLSIRIEAPTEPDQRCRLYLQSVNVVIDCETGKKVFNAIIESDITGDIQRAATAELAISCNITEAAVGTMSVGTPKISSPEIDWCALADEIQAAHEFDTGIEETSRRFADSLASDSSSATIHLLEQIDQIRVAHSAFMIMRSFSFHTDGKPATVGIPWISQHLQRELEVYDSGSKAGKHIRDEVVQAISNGMSGSATPFDRTTSSGIEVRCVPLSDTIMKSADAFICFLGGKV